MSALHHHQRPYVAALDAERRAGGDLDRLVRAAANGEQSAWNAIVSRFTRRLTRLVASHRVPSQDVDDVVQLTFIKLYENLGSLRDPNALPAWLDTTARRETLRSIRAMLRERPFDVGLIEDLPAPGEPADGRDEALCAELDRALETLPERQRTLLRELANEQQPSYAEIAERLAMPIGAIGPTRGRALERLRGDEALRVAAAAAIADRQDTRGADSHVPYWAGAVAA